MKTLTGINFIEDVSEVTTLAECPVCGKIFVLEDCKQNKSENKISLFFINCPECNKELHFFFWFDW